MVVLSDESTALYEFCLRYFTNVGARMFPAPQGVLCMELPREIDKELTDRPFYWMWVDAMKENPPNTVLYLKFHPDAEEHSVPDGAKPELITRGCYRLMRIIASAKNRGSFAVGYEHAPCVTPFALFSIKVSFVCDVRQDFLESYAIDLRDLRIYPDAMKRIERLPIVDERPKTTQIAPIPYDLDQLFALAEERVQQDIERRDHTWAVEAQKRLSSELQRLDAYYTSLDDEPGEGPRPDADSPQLTATAAKPGVRPQPAGRVQSGVRTQPADGAQTSAELPDDGTAPIFSRAAERELRRAEIVWRTEPKIEIRPTQFALVYLSRPPSDL